MLKLMHLHDPDKHYIIRVCMTVAEADWIVEGSVVRNCDECDVEVWYHENQATPVVPGITFEGEVLLCLPCTLLHQQLDPEEAKWIGPRPPGL